MTKKSRVILALAISSCAVAALVAAILLTPPAATALYVAAAGLSVAALFTILSARKQK